MDRLFPPFFTAPDHLRFWVDRHPGVLDKMGMLEQKARLLVAKGDKIAAEKVCRWNDAHSRVNVHALNQGNVAASVRCTIAKPAPR